MEKLPPTSYVRLVDIWLICGQLIPFIEVILLTLRELYNEEDYGNINHHGFLRKVPILEVSFHLNTSPPNPGDLFQEVDMWEWSESVQSMIIWTRNLSNPSNFTCITSLEILHVNYCTCSSSLTLLPLKNAAKRYVQRRGALAMCKMSYLHLCICSLCMKMSSFLYLCACTMPHTFYSSYGILFPVLTPDSISS